MTCEMPENSEGQMFKIQPPFSPQVLHYHLN